MGTIIRKQITGTKIFIAIFESYIRKILSEAKSKTTVAKKIGQNLLKLKDKMDMPDYEDILQCLQEIKIFYTDWKHYDKDNAIKAGIVGPQHIKEQLKHFSKKHNLLF